MFKSYIGLFLLVLVTSCSTTKKVKDGRTAFNLKQYAKAIEFLQSDAQQYAEGEEYAEVAYLLGESYKYVNDSPNSLKWYVESAKNGYGPEAFYEMAYMLKKNERYEDAILSFQRLLKLTPARANEIKKEIEKCRQARRWTDVSGDHEYVVEALSVNSTHSDYAPFLLSNNELVFTSDRVEGEEDIYNWTGNAFSDLYILDIENEMVKPFSDDINTPANEGTATFNKDGTQMFFTRCQSDIGDSYCRIYKSEKRNGAWTNAEMAFLQKTGINYGDPVLIENDSVLIFTSNDPIGMGGHDLYYSLLEEGRWTDPDLMPPYLNTIGAERFPTWDQSTGTLYYSSDFLPGLGGLDIFSSSLNADGSWSRPENVLAPINSNEDDYSHVVVPVDGLASDEKMKIYFTSTRGVFGNDDLYSLTELKKPEDYNVIEEEVVTEEVEEEDAKKTFFLEINVKEKLFAVSGNPNSYVVGLRKVAGASVRFTTPDREDIFTTKDDGTILVPIDTGSVYQVLAGKREYLNKGALFQISEEYTSLSDGEVFKLNIEIDKIYQGVEIVIDNIYYDYNESYVRDDAKSSLDYLANILKDNPAISIELSAHTDCRGEDDYNLSLSKDRANAAIEYIKNTTSVPSGRLSSQGYGANQPEIDCECDSCTEEEHQINRRTTFRVVE